MSGRKPYIWVTSLAGLVSGDKSCQWAAWLKVHDRDYVRRPPDNEGHLAAWNVEHAGMVRARAAELRAGEYPWQVTVEDQNKFTYRGKTAVVGGKPDIVAVLDGHDDGVGDGPVDIARVVDCKSGKERDSDVVQVAIYMLLGPHDLDRLEGRAMSGEVQYKHRRRPVLYDDARAMLGDVVAQVGVIAGDVQPARAPSASECRYCDIATCPDRAVERPETDEPVAGALF